MKLRTLLFLCFLTGTMLFAQTDTEIDNDPELSKQAAENYKNRPNTIQVTDNIFMLKGMGGNIAVHHGIDGVLMIDTQFERASEAILIAIQKETEMPLQFIINTHGHKDHTSGNKNFKRKGATIIAHENTREVMLSQMYQSAEQQALANLDKELERLKNQGGDNEKEAYVNAEKDRLIAILKEQSQENLDIDYEMLPAIAFQDDLLFHYNDEDIKLTHIPNAHTSGDVIVHFPKSNVLHTGDAFVSNLYPFIDLDNGGSFQGYRNGLTTIMNRINTDTKIIPGHGELATKADVAETRRMMNIFYEKVTFEYLKGKTEDEVAQMRDFSKMFDDQGYGDGFITTEQFLRSTYKAVDKELGQKRAENEERRKKLEQAKKRAAAMDKGNKN
ncbi:MAG: MBL fold metallo-hydrolase [Marinirhabdus sp.]|nr:MBL fold metallo-hydrolase [Marinirhabdus sp.]